MIGFKQFVMKAQKTKKCPEGYRFSKKLGVCVPIGQRTYYPFLVTEMVVIKMINKMVTKMEMVLEMEMVMVLVMEMVVMVETAMGMGHEKIYRHSRST